MNTQIKIENACDGMGKDGGYSDVMDSPPHQESSSTGNGSSNQGEFIIVNGVRVYNKPLVDKLLEIHSPRLALVPQPKAVSFLWKTYRRVCVDGILQPFACCIVCKRIVSYQSRTGTSSLIRHKCPPELRPILNLLREDKTPWTMTTTPVDVTQKPDILERAIKRQRRETRGETSSSPTGYVQVTPSNVEALTDQEESSYHLYDESEDPGHLVVEKARQFFLRDLWPISLLEATSFVELVQSFVDLGAKVGSVQVGEVLSRTAVFSDLTGCIDHTKNAKEASVYSVELWKNFEKKRFFTLRCHVLDENFHRISTEFLTAEYKADTTEFTEKLSQIFDSIGKPIKLPTDLPEQDMVLVVGDDVMKLDECVVLPSFSGFMNSILDELCDIDDVPVRYRKWKDLKCHLAEIKDAVLRAQIQGLLELATQMFDNLSSDTVQIGACYLWWLKFQRKVQVWSSPIFEKLKTREYRFQPLYYYSLCLDPNFKSLKMIDDEKRIEAYEQLREFLKNVPKPPKLETGDKLVEESASGSSFFEEFMESESDQNTDDLERFLRHMMSSRSDSFDFWKKSDEFPCLRSIAKVLLAIPCVSSLKDRVLDPDSEKTVEKRFMLGADDVFVLRYKDAFCQI